MAPKKQAVEEVEEKPPDDETQVFLKFFATCEYLEEATVTFAAFGKEVTSLPAANGEEEPFAGFRFAAGETPAEFGQIVTSYKKPPPPKTGTPDEFLNKLVSKSGEVSVTVKAGAEVYGPSTFRLLQLLQSTTLAETVTLTKEINAEEKAAHEAAVAEAEANEEAAPQPPEMPTIKVDVRAETVKQFAPPEDYYDWNVLHVKMGTLGSVPPSMMPDMQEMPSGKVDTFAFDLKLNTLGAVWEGSNLIKPEVEEEEAAPEENGNGDVADDPMIHLMTMQTFKDGMERLQYPGHLSDVEETFKFLDQNRTGKVSRTRFEELASIGAPASVKKMLAFRTFLVEKFANLEIAFDALDTKKTGIIELPQWHKALSNIGCTYGPLTMSEIFFALDPSMNGSIEKPEFLTLHLYHALSRLTAVQQFKEWMLKKFKTIKKAYKEFDDNHSGSLALQEFQQVMRSYKSPIHEDTVEALFHMIDVDYDTLLKQDEFENVEHVSLDIFLKELTSFKKKFTEKYGNDISATFKTFKKRFDPKNKHKDSLIFVKDFAKIVKEMEWEPIHAKFEPRYIFTFLDEDFGGSLHEKEFRILLGFNEQAGSNAIKKVRKFLFMLGDMRTAWRFLNEDLGPEFFELSLKKKPRVDFDVGEQSFYMGRRSTMHMLETYREQKGVWVHMSVDPKDPAAADFEEKSEIALAHHARFFVTFPETFVQPKKGGNLNGYGQLSSLMLPKYLASHKGAAFASGAADDSDDDEEEAAEGGGAEADGDGEGGDNTNSDAVYESFRTFVQYHFSFERTFEELEPKNIPEFDVSSIPPPPEGAPELTPEEHYSNVVRECVTLVADRIKNSPLAVADPSGMGQLGSRILPDAQSLEKLLQSLYDEEQFQQVCEKLSVAAKHVVDSERAKHPEKVPNVRGLCGTERDKFYSDLYSDLLGQAYATLEQVVQEHEAARARQYWHFRALDKEGELAQKVEDDTYERLAKEATMTKSYARAAELYERRLALEFNKYNADPYYEYAVFVCRWKYTPDGGDYLEKALDLLQRGIGACDGLKYAKRAHIEMLALLLVTCDKYNDALALFTMDTSGWGDGGKLVDKHTAFFIALTYLKKSEAGENEELKAHDMAMFKKYLALARRPPYIYKGHGVFDVNVTFAPVVKLFKELMQKEYEARGQEAPKEEGFDADGDGDESEKDLSERTDSDIDAQDLADIKAEQEEASKEEEDEFGFIRPRVFHPAPLAADMGALAAIHKTLEFGLPILTLSLMDAEFLRPETLASEKGLMCRAEAIFFQQRYEDCLQILDEVHASSNGRCQAMRVLQGKCYRALGMNDGAVKAWEKAIGFLEPCTDPDVFVSLGTVHLEHSAWDLAKTYFERALELQGSATAWYGSGVAAYRLGEFEQAYTALGEANMLDTERTVVWAFLCASALRLRKPTVALQAARYVLNDKDDAPARFGDDAAWPTTWKDLFHEIAEGFLDVRLPKPAAKAARLALALAGDHPEPYLYLAKARALDGDPARATAELEVAIGLAYDREEKYDYQEVGGIIAAQSHDIHLQQRIGNAVEAAENRLRRKIEGGFENGGSEPYTPAQEPAHSKFSAIPEEEEEEYGSPDGPQSTMDSM